VALFLAKPFLANFTPIPCQFRSLQTPFLANTIPCEFHFLISLINPFLANSHGCELWGFSLNIPLLALSTPFPCKLNSLKIQRPPFVSVLTRHKRWDHSGSKCFERLSLERQFASVSSLARRLLNTGNQNHCKKSCRPHLKIHRKIK